MMGRSESPPPPAGEECEASRVVSGSNSVPRAGLTADPTRQATATDAAQVAHRSVIWQQSMYSATLSCRRLIWISWIRVFGKRGGVSSSKASVGPCRGSLDHPLNVAAIDRGEAVARRHHDGNKSAGFDPSLDFCMAIGKTKNAAAVVVAGRKVGPIVRISGIGNHPAIVNAVRMLICKDPQHGWLWVFDIDHFLVTPVPVIPMRVEIAVLALIGATQ